MIFVTPEYWLNTQHAQGTRDYMARRGYFSDIFHFNETPIFAHVTSSIAIWRYVKSSAVKPRMRVVKYNAKKRLSAADLERLGRREAGLTTEVFERRAWEVGRKWLLVSEATEEELVSYEAVCTPRGQQNYMSLGEIADIGNGMVSGLDQAFAIPSETKLSAIEQAASIKVLKAKQIRQFKHGALTRYIYLGGTGMDETKLRHDYPTFYDQLQKYRDALAKRYSYGRKLPYWEWAFARSYALFSRRVDRIFVPGKERISHKDYFRFSYVEAGVYPTQDVTGVFLKPGVKEDLRYVLAVLNSPQVFDWLKCNGVVKGNLVEFSERPLASIPIRMIDWEDATEMTEHNAIVAMVTDYLENREASVMAALIQRVGDFLTRARS
jgi:adenine-specific DNA-methyltransferase